MTENKLDEWYFRFGLCQTSPDQIIPESKCEELLALIIGWAEENDFGVGGGYRPYAEQEKSIPGDPYA